MKNGLKKLWEKYPQIRKVAGVALIILGCISIITPFTPFGFLVLVGLELLGLRTVVWEKLKDYLKDTRPRP